MAELNKPRYDEGPTMVALQELLAFAEQGNLRETAALLGLDTATLSRKLNYFKRTRTAPGGKRPALLARDGKFLRLTEKGQALLPPLRELVRCYDWFLRNLGEVAVLPTVRLGLGSFSAELYWPQLLAELRRTPAGFAVEPVITRGRRRIEDVAAGRMDLAIVTHDRVAIQAIAAAQQPAAPPLVVATLARHSLCIAAKAASPAGRELRAVPVGKTVPVAWLNGRTLVGLDPKSGIRRRLEAWLHDRGLSVIFDTQAGTGGWALALELARHDMGVALAPQAALTRRATSGLVVRRLPKDLAIIESLIHRTSPLTEVQQAVKRELQRLARKAAQPQRAGARD